MVVPAPAPAPANTPAANLSLGPNYHDHDRTLRKWRLGIRIATAVFIAIAMIIFIARGAIETERLRQNCQEGYRCYYYSYEYDLISLPILAAAMIWNIAEFITLCVNKRGALPGVHVGLDLVMWCALLAGGIISIFQWAFSYNYDQSMGTAGAALELIGCVGHFTLFVLACIATHRRRMLFKQHILGLHAEIATRQSAAQHYPPTTTFPPAPPGMTYYLLPTHMQPQARYHELDHDTRPQSTAPTQETGSPMVEMAHRGPAMPFTVDSRHQ